MTQKSRSPLKHEGNPNKGRASGNRRQRALVLPAGLLSSENLGVRGCRSFPATAKLEGEVQVSWR